MHTAASARAGRIIAFVLALAMVTAGLQLGEAEPALAETNQPKSARELPAMWSEPAKVELPSTPLGDYTNAPPTVSEKGKRPSRPTSFDPSRSVLEADQTTPTRAMYANPDGSRTAKVIVETTYQPDPALWEPGFKTRRKSR